MNYNQQNYNPNMYQNYVLPNTYQNVGYFQQQAYPQQAPVPRFKFINSPDDIVPGDVPMDGSMAFFVMNDNSGIFGKCWDQSGRLQTVRFSREELSAPPIPQSNDISDRLDRIESNLNDLMQTIRRNNYKKGRMNYGDQRKPVDGATPSNRPSDG